MNREVEDEAEQDDGVHARLPTQEYALRTGPFDDSEDGLVDLGKGQDEDVRDGRSTRERPDWEIREWSSSRDSAGGDVGDG